MSSLALVLIARDEARCIDRCLRSAAAFVDEMWVLDTGSQDDTLSVARRCGAQVAVWPWRGDVAAARNAALALCGSDWRLVMHADEWIGGCAAALQDWCRDTTPRIGELREQRRPAGDRGRALFFDRGRAACSEYRVTRRFSGHTLVEVKIGTGRTHQIRVHLMHLRCPVLCDKQYGGRSRVTLGELRSITRQKRLGGDAPDDEVLMTRHALHAHRLSITHPSSGKPLTFEAPLPADMAEVLKVLRSGSAS